MNCAKCDGLLQTNILEGVEIDQCQQCGGIWLDLGELSQLREHKNLSVNQSTHNIQDNKPANCPKGHGSMIRVHDLNRPNIVLDSCSVCHGLWLDAGELEKLTASNLRLTIQDFIRDLLN